MISYNLYIGNYLDGISYNTFFHFFLQGQSFVAHFLVHIQVTDSLDSLSVWLKFVVANLSESSSTAFAVLMRVVSRMASNLMVLSGLATDLSFPSIFKL